MTDAVGQDTTVRFQLHRDESGWPPVDIEHMPAAAAGGDHYRLEHSPLFAWNIAAGDLVEALPDADGLLWATTVAEHSGHLALRALPHPDGPLRGAPDRVLEAFAPLGVRGRVTRTPPVAALDVPPDANLSAVRALLEDGHRDGRWTYQEALVSDAWRALATDS